jgi:hypothetical protein
MFNFFKSPSTTDILAEMDQKWYNGLREVKKALDKLQSTEYIPIVTQADDLTTVTFKGPNVTTTITTKTVDLPKVLEQYGLQMPTVATKKTTKKSK